MNLFEQSPFKEEQETFLRLLDVANATHSAKKERAIYEENLKNYRDWYATIDYAQTEGIEKGMQEGMQKGCRKGSRKGSRKAVKRKTPDSPKDEEART